MRMLTVWRWGCLWMVIPASRIGWISVVYGFLIFLAVEGQDSLKCLIDVYSIDRSLVQAGVTHAIIEPELGLYDGLFLLPLGWNLAWAVLEKFSIDSGLLCPTSQEYHCPGLAIYFGSVSPGHWMFWCCGCRSYQKILALDIFTRFHSWLWNLIDFMPVKQFETLRSLRNECLLHH